MTQADRDQMHPPRPGSQALAVLEAFSSAAGVPFDRILAARVLGEAERAIPGAENETWSQRLVEVGESLNLRIRTIETGLDAALTFLAQRIPVATYLHNPETGEEQSCLLLELRGRRVKIACLHGGQDEWLTFRKLRDRLGLTTPESQRRWVIGQAAMSCDPDNRGPHLASGSHFQGGYEQHEEAGHHGGGHHGGGLHGGGHHGPAPLPRLLQLLRPELPDVWVVIVFSVVVGMLTLASPIAVEALVSTVAFGQYLQPVIILALLLFTFLAFAAAMKVLIAFVVEVLQRRLFVRVVEDLAYRLPRVQQVEFDHVHPPELTNRFLDVTYLQKGSASLLLEATAIILQTVIGMGVLAFYHPFLLGFDLVLLALICFAVFVLGRGAVTTAIVESRAKYATAAWLQELARHPTAFKLHSGAQFALDRADQLAIHWLDARRRHFRILMRQVLFALGTQVVASTALLGLGGWLVLQGELTLGQLVASELIVMVIVGAFAKLGKHMETFYDLLASTDKLGHLFDLQIENHDKLFHLREGTPAEVALRGVNLAMAGTTILNNVNCLLPSGSSTVIVGSPGAGKSLFVDLLCGLRQPTSGHIELDGIDLRELRADALREQLGVARGVEIFEGSIDENVHLNRPHISAADVREALDLVGLLDEVLQLPAGMNTRLLTGGAPLSTSQALRLMLARAIVGRPRLLVIDGTLDGLPDQIVWSVIRNLTGRQAPWTLVITSGRREVIDVCDHRIDLPGGNSRSSRVVLQPSGNSN